MRNAITTALLGVGSARLPRFGKMTMLLAPEGDGGGGGGGGGANPQLSQAAIDQVNGIVKAHLQRVDFGAMITPLLSKALETSMPQMVQSIVGEVTKQVTAANPSGGAGDKKKDDKGGNAQIPDELKNQMTALAAKVEELNGKLKEKDDALARAALRQREGTVEASMKKALETSKVKPELLAGALAVLKGKAAIEWTKDDQDNDVPQVKVKRNAPGVGAYEEKISLEKFVGEWTQTDEGKSYLPAPGGRGSGVGARQQGGGGQQPSFVAPGGGGQQQQQPQGGNHAPQISDHELGNMMLAAYNNGTVE